MDLSRRLRKQVRVREAAGRKLLVSGIDDDSLCPARGVQRLWSQFICPNRRAGGRTRHVKTSLRNTFGIAGTRSMMQGREVLMNDREICCVLNE